MEMATHAPSSPRLPSPPPPAEIQIGPVPQSPGSSPNHQVPQMEQTAIDANAKRRIHPGTRASEMAAGPPLIPLNELDSAFQLQEHLAALHYHHTATNTNPVSRETAKILGTPPPGIDRTLWLYELCRFLIEQCNALIVGFLFDTPPCSAVTCPEMRASEWQFLCAVHDQPKSCCAIDYCCHTLDWAANVVTNPQIFPSRFVALSDAHDKGAAIKNLVNVFRRLHRIFAHAWFQHRGVFWTVEGQTGLYVFFKTVCDMHDLLPGENYKLPPEAEGLEAPPRSNLNVPGDGPKILQNPGDPSTQGAAAARPVPGVTGEGEDDHHSAVNSRTSTRRHIRSSPSTGSAVTTVMEADEDDGSAGDVSKRFRKMRLMDPPLAEDDMETAEVPVLVEQDTPVHSTPMGNGNTAAKTGDEEPQSLPVATEGARSAPGAAATSEEVESASHDVPRTVESFLESPDSDLPSQPLSEESGPKDVADTHHNENTSTAAAAGPSDHGSSDDADAAAMLKATSIADFAGDAGEDKPTAGAEDNGPGEEAAPSLPLDDKEAEAPQEETDKENPAKANEEAKAASEPQQLDASKVNSD
ncbi:hypothetical protein PpBr36_01727 [Pyricularia pennisetigena]|uniref:hypothetical protein n=1 Tax=Pyricularia pennisetigena TaxID=1578925 RepID=UPI001151791D|nr:hypothetical protein PpBr36_01727 [Pyricularia pennisetigena]TLS27981.1 hypothetical protein PpBr36_01727 [Pyricularia pennisetigena]